MEDVKLRLQASALSHLSLNNLKPNFSFIVDTRVFHVPLVIAEFLSPKVSICLSNNPKLNSYLIEVKIDPQVFQSLLGMFTGKNVYFSPQHIRQLVLLSEELESVSIKQLILQSFHHDNEIRNDIYTLAVCSIHNQSPEEEIVQKISSNLDKISLTSLAVLSPTVLFSILSNDHLVLKSEDELCQLITSLIELPEYYILLETLQAQYVSQTLFLDLIDKVNLAKVGPKFWESIVQRMKLVTSSFFLNSPRWEKCTTPPEFTETQFKVPESGHSGIFCHLSQKFTKDTLKKRLIIQTSTSTLHKPICVIEWTRDKQWVSHDSPNQWIQVILKNRIKIFLIAYQLHAHGGPSFIKSWTLEGSNDKISWIQIDQRQDENQVAQANAIVLFHCQNPGTFTVFRITMNGQSAHRDYVFCLRGIEFYGTLISPPDNTPTPIVREREPNYPTPI